MSDASTLVDRLWSYCDVLRDDGLSYGDYLEQLTYLLPQDGRRVHAAAVAQIEEILGDLQSTAD